MEDRSNSPWSAPDTVAGFAQSPPNSVLVRYARELLARIGTGRALDLGCGAGRNAIPLARQGWEIVGVDNSPPMLVAAARRAGDERLSERVHLAQAAMDAIPARDHDFDLVIAHGIWNLARSATEFRRAVREGARVAKPGAGLFVFTFSRHTLPPQLAPVAGEPFVFTEFSGEPQCFLTDRQLLAELEGAGFTPDPAVPLTEHNLPRPGAIGAGRAPVIYEAAFRRTG